MVNKIVPKEIPLTSFSILFSRFKGELERQMEGAKRLDQLEDGSRILISEGCSHHRQCGDIGTQKLLARNAQEELCLNIQMERIFQKHFLLMIWLFTVERAC